MALMREMPWHEKPREKALQYGIRTLSSRELLAILIRTGQKGRSVLEVADDLLNKSGGIGGESGLDAAKPVGQLLAAVEQHQRMAGVVDVFRGAGEVDKLGGLAQLRVMGDPLLDPVFNCLDIVVCRPFDFLDPFAILQRKL